MSFCALLLGCDTGGDLRERSERALTGGIEALDAQDFERAWSLCDHARRLRPDEVAAHRCAAMAAMGWRRWDLAARDLEPLLESSEIDSVEPWIPVSLWLARVRCGDRGGAARVLEWLQGGGEEIREAILALAIAEDVDTPAWGFSTERLHRWPGALPLIAAEGQGTERVPPPRAGEDPDITGYRALRAALDGRGGELFEGAPVPHPGVALLLAAAAWEVPDSMPVPPADEDADDDPSMLLLARFFSSGTRSCDFSAGLSTTARVQAAAALLEGICLERTGDFDAALARYNRAVALAPWHKVARLNRALLLARAGRSAAARVELSQLEEAAPGHPVVKVLAAVLAGAEGDTDALDAARAELDESAPGYRTWLDQVLAR